MRCVCSSKVDTFPLLTREPMGLQTCTSQKVHLFDLKKTALFICVGMVSHLLLVAFNVLADNI